MNIDNHPIVTGARAKLENGETFRLVKTNVDGYIRQVFEDPAADTLTEQLEATIASHITPTAVQLLLEANAEQITACCGEDIDAFRALLWLHVNTAQYAVKLKVNDVLLEHAERRVAIAWLTRTQLFGLALERHPLCRMAYNRLVASESESASPSSS